MLQKQDFLTITLRSLTVDRDNALPLPYQKPEGDTICESGVVSQVDSVSN